MALFRVAGAIAAALSAAQAAPEILLDEDFSDLADWKDLSLAVDWGTAASPASAFSAVGGVLQLNTATAGYTGYTSANQLRTFTAVDFQFPRALDHSSSVLTIEFRARWNRYTTGKAELNRFLVTVQHDYPAGGLVLNDPSLVTARAGAPWARPAYQIRIRGADDTALDSANGGSTILQYGGGTIPESEYEYYAGGWWMPGFNSSAYGNGTHSSGTVSPPGEYSNGGPFPFNSWINTPTGLAGTYWQRFRFIIYPDRMELWRDKLEQGNWTLEHTMILPALDMVPAVAINRGYYNYFDSLEGVRLFWRAGSIPGDQVFIDSIRIEALEYADNYAYWLHQHFTEQEIAAAAGALNFEADFNGDGIANGLLYFSGLDPRRRYAQHEIAKVEPASGHLRVTYPRSWYAHGLAGGVEWSTDLANWRSDGVTEARLEDTIDPLDANADDLHRSTYFSRPEVVRGSWTMQAEVPMPPSGPLFVRLNIHR